jgi:3-phosphoshikimate 1-carboxyvinyltransferase
MQPPDELHLQPMNVCLPADISAAAFLLVAALITPGSELIIRDVGINPTRTGLLDVLVEMGADLRVEQKPDQGGEPVGDLVVRASTLQGIEVSGLTVVRMIDEFPAFAVAAAFAQGVTVVRDAEELRYKESDRIQAICRQLRQLGAIVQETQDGFILHGGGLSGGLVQAEGDHRLAMSLAVAGLASRVGLTVQGAEIFRESFPGFLATLTSLGAEIWAEE